MYTKLKNNFGSIEAAKVLLFLLNSGIFRDGNISTVLLRGIKYITYNVIKELGL